MCTKLPSLLIVAATICFGFWTGQSQAQPPPPDLLAPPPVPAEKSAIEMDNAKSAPAAGSASDLPADPDPRPQLLLPLQRDGELASPSAEDRMGGMGGRSPFGNQLVGQAPLRGDYRATWYASEPVAGQSANLGYVRRNSPSPRRFGKRATWTSGRCLPLSAMNFTRLMPSCPILGSRFPRIFGTFDSAQPIAICLKMVGSLAGQSASARPATNRSMASKK